MAVDHSNKVLLFLQSAVKSMNSTGNTEKQGSITEGQLVDGVKEAAMVFVIVTPADLEGFPEFETFMVPPLSTVMS